MIYHSLQEVYAAKGNALQKLCAHIEHLAPAQVNIHPSNGGWSIAEIVEHLALVESQGLRLITALLKKTEDAGKTTPPGSPFEISVRSLYERSQTEKYSAGNRFSPTGKVPVADSLEMLRGIQTELERLEPRLRSADLTSVTFPHWVFGPLNLGQWLVFIGLHEERHLGQVGSILASSEFGQVPR